MEDKELKAAQILVEIYFTIAEELIGEDEVRKRRDEMIENYKKEGQVSSTVQPMVMHQLLKIKIPESSDGWSLKQWLEYYMTDTYKNDKLNVEEIVKDIRQIAKLLLKGA